MITLLALKKRKAALISCMEMERESNLKVSEKTFIDYKIVLAQLAAAEDKLLKPIGFA